MYVAEYHRFSAPAHWAVQIRIDGTLVKTEVGEDVVDSPSTTSQPRMAWWGWLALLAIPGWLLWVTGIGYAESKHCIEGGIFRQPAVSAAQRHACEQTPAAWAPTRGLKFGTEGLSAEYWVAGLVLAMLFAVVVVYFAHRPARRSHPENSELHQ